MRIRLSFFLAILVATFCSKSNAQDDQSLAYYAIRLDTSSELCLTKTKSLFSEIKLAKAAETVADPSKLGS
jgi:hypothetical protein